MSQVVDETREIPQAVEAALENSKAKDLPLSLEESLLLLDNGFVSVSLTVKIMRRVIDALGLETQTSISETELLEIALKMSTHHKGADGRRSPMVNSMRFRKWLMESIAAKVCSKV